MLTVSSQLDIDLPNADSHSKEEMKALHNESKNTVEWNGKQFTTKPVSLSRVNLSVMKDGQSYQDRNIKIRYSTAVLSLGMNFLPDCNQIMPAGKLFKYMFVWSPLTPVMKCCLSIIQNV